MKQTIASVILVLAISMVLGALPSVQQASASPYIDPHLANSQATASLGDTVEVVVTLDHTPTSTDAQAIAALSRVSVPMTEVPMILAATTYSNINAIAAHPGVVSLFKNRPMAYFGQVKTVTHSFGEIPVQHSWWNDLMRVPDAWALGFKGQGVTVAVVDSGIDAANPSLGFSFPNGLRSGPERVIQNVKVLTVGELVSTQPLGPDQLFLEDQINTDHTSGHGTLVAGLIAGTGTASNRIYMGAAPEANVVGLGAGETLFIFHIIASYNWIISHQALYNIRITNNSWGSDFECTDLAGDSNPEACRSNSPINAVTKVAHDRGIAVFFAAGNDGPGHPTINPFSEPPWVISVGAGVESKGLTDFSSRGCEDNDTHPVCTNALEQRPDIVAPGINVISTRATTGVTLHPLTASADAGNIVSGLQPFYATFAGTSAASPMAAGVGAVVLSAYELTPDELKAAMKGSADPMVGYLPHQVGEGRTNAFNAVKLALGKGFKPTKVREEAFGIQRFVYKGFIGGAVAATANWADTNTPVFSGAQRLSFDLRWTLPANPTVCQPGVACTSEWRNDIYGPNDVQVTRFRSTTLGTGVSFTVDDPAAIASFNNPGLDRGTWTVAVVNFGEGSEFTLTVDVQYPTKSKTSMDTAKKVHVEDSESHNGQLSAVFQTYQGTVQSVNSLTPGSQTITQPTGSLVSIVQVVVVDTAGDIVEVRGAFVMTQADLTARADAIQQQLLATLDPALAGELQAELSAIQSALLTAPTSENPPPLPA